MDPVTHLRAAAEILRRDGWTSYAFVDTTGAKCALGAMGMREHCLLLQLLESHETVRALAMVIGYALSYEPPGVAVLNYARYITAWNDDPDQTKANVIQTLELAALVEEQRLLLAQLSETRTEAT